MDMLEASGISENPFMNTLSISADQLDSIKCLHRLQPAERLTLLEFLEPVECTQGEVLFEEGDTGDYMYLILEGKIRVFTRKNGEKVTLKLLESGDAFGDIALFHHTPRLASVEATGDCQLLKLSAAALERLTTNHPAISAKFLHALAVSLTHMYRDFR